MWHQERMREAQWSWFGHQIQSCLHFSTSISNQFYFFFLLLFLGLWLCSAVGLCTRRHVEVFETE